MGYGISPRRGLEADHFTVHQKPRISLANELLDVPGRVATSLIEVEDDASEGVIEVD